MKSNPKLGVMGNIKTLFAEGNKTNNEVYNNRIAAEQGKAETDEAVVELGGIVEENEVSIADLTDAVLELAEIIIGE